MASRHDGRLSGHGQMSGPLEGLTIVELGGIGPVPFAGMMLADHGASVTQITRPRMGGAKGDLTTRGKRSIGLDLKSEDGVEVALKLIEGADVVMEGFRPGTAERLGLGPDVSFEQNPSLIYGRMTGWGQGGPLSQQAGHDINYISLSGVLGSIGRAGHAPVPPLNLVGDFGGGALFLAFGLVSAVLVARESGRGQVVDAAMTDGSAVLMTPFFDVESRGGLGPVGTNLLDSGSHFYNTYETSDGGYVSVGPLESEFYAELLEKLGLESSDLPEQMDSTAWPSMQGLFAERFRSRTRDEWVRIFAGSDACFAPVLGVAEAPHHPHNVARRSFVEVDGVVQPAPAPRFSATPSRPPGHTPVLGEDSVEVLLGAGFSQAAIDGLRASGVVG